MGKDTAISWCDHTFNPVWGCTKVSPGCDHCFAADLDKRWSPHDQHWGKGVPRREFGDAHWDEPLNWNREAKRADVKRRVFCGSMCDVMDDEWRAGTRERLWELIDNTPNLIWQLLTKRPQRYGSYLPSQFAHNNVWLGTSAENQHFYNIRWSVLRVIARDYGLVSFISYEPALGPLSIGMFAASTCREQEDRFSLTPDWIICGGESGPNRRPMEQQWAEDLQAECEVWEVDFFMKQMSARTPEEGAALIPIHLLSHQFPEPHR